MVVKGRKLTQKEHWQKLKNELKDMTPKQKLEHLWEYYKWVLGVVLAIIIVIGTVIGSVITMNTETIISGTIVNVPVDMAGYFQLQEGYYQHAKTEGRQAVGLSNFTFLDPYTTVEQTYTWDIIDSVTAKVGADDLDYMMYDELAATFFMSPDYFADLRELFSEEELSAMGNAVINLLIEETGEQIPIAIDIRDTDFYDIYITGDKPIYLSFGVRLPRKEACKDFWQFIKGGKTTVMQTVIAGFAIDVPAEESAVKSLKKDYITEQGCVSGDHRVELTQYTFLPAEDDEGREKADAKRKYVRSLLDNGALDYVLCGADAFAQLEKECFLDLSQILTEQQLKELGSALVMEDGVAVAVDVSSLPRFADNKEGAIYLAFNAKTGRLQACRDLWNMIHAE